MRDRRPKVASGKGSNESSATSRGYQIYASQIGEYREGRNRSLPNVTEQQGKGHESREPHQESPKLGGRTYAREDWSV